MGSEFNPLDKIHLGESVRDAVLKQPVHALPPPERFPGAGIYAIYYTGDFPAYKRLAEKNRSGRFAEPIYVGEAVREGSRKGGLAASGKPTYKLFTRLKEHAGSIDEAENLRLEDFHCRYLAVDDIWIPLGEALMIETFKPVWNMVIDGFGIHTPGGRRIQMTSAWDTLHPGRPFVRRLNLPPYSKTQTQLVKEVQGFLALPKQARVGALGIEIDDE